MNEFIIKSFWNFINAILCQLVTLWNGSRPEGIIPTSDIFSLIPFTVQNE